MWSSREFASIHPEWTSAQTLVLGLVVGLLYFACVVAHELGHSLVARRYGIPIKSITLFIFGGIAQIEREPEKPIQEFHIAIAGPAVSMLIGGMFLTIGSLAADLSPRLATPSQWLGQTNLMLGGFNLVPGFPLDGGRILRAIAWKWTGSFNRCTAIATTTGSLFAYMLISLGVSGPQAIWSVEGIVPSCFPKASEHGMAEYTRSGRESA
jgi:Zn-dependent protease